MVRIAAYLEHNGVAGVKPAHVKDLAFLERMETKAQLERERGRHERQPRRAASLADLDISLPEGMRVDMLHKIN